ncbi:universal stress protein [Actinopolyspora sp. H202]|uniref:universal stress protein n=1 Tax=Actinopolyspora sp. H202 TaxID=1500456 RepID=UPI003EE6C31B
MCRRTAFRTLSRAAVLVSRAAIRHAVKFGGRIKAVQTWDVPTSYDWSMPGLQNLGEDTEKSLAETVGEVAGESPVPIDRSVSRGHPTRALLDVARESGAELIVVGNRGHGGFASVLLGSVSQHLVHHADRPVVGR